MTSALAAFRSAAVALAGFMLGLLLAALALPIAAHAQAPAPTPAGPHKPVDNDARTVSIVVYGNDPCPQGKDDEIVVCAREPENERYRIPKRFRDKKKDAAPGTSWAAKTESADDASRTAAGLPNTCSAVGSGGATGCYQQFMSQAYAQRRQAQAAKATAASGDGTPQD